MMMKMVPHNHHHRPLSPFDNDSSAGGGDGHGPTTTCSSVSSLYNTINNSITHHHHHHYDINKDLASGGSSASPAAVSAAAIHSSHCGHSSALTTTLQPFDISTPFKSPGMMAASLGFPFTIAQWKELERQAMIYKYMMASLPVPTTLLMSSPPFSPFDGGFNFRVSSGGSDPEPGRCRRTDGKKWRCSRDVAPNHKYCERHMHRGRPRSRKPVEVQTDGATTTNNTNNNVHQNKRARQDFHHPYPSHVVAVAASDPTIANGGSSTTASTQFVQCNSSQTFHESNVSLDKYGVKAANFGSLASVPSVSQPRGLDWMLKGNPISMTDSDPQWQPLIKENPCNNNNATISSYEDPLYLTSYASFNSGLDQQSRRCSNLFINPLLSMENHESLKPRGFIDAWSNDETLETNNGNKTHVSSNAKLSLSSLDLSMGGGSMVEEEMGSIHMGLGLMEEPSDGDTENGNKTHISNWLTPSVPWAGSTTPGGPLAEVLRPSAVAPAATTTDAASDPPSPVGTMVSSPSGVLQKTLGSMSDCSSNSSPTVASSRANSEFALLLFSKAN